MKKHKNLIIIGIVLLVAIVAVWWFWPDIKSKLGKKEEDEDKRMETQKQTIRYKSGSGPSKSTASGSSAPPPVNIPAPIEVGDSVTASKNVTIYNGDLKSLYRKAVKGDYIGVILDTHRPEFYYVRTASQNQVLVPNDSVKKFVSK